MEAVMENKDQGIEKLRSIINDCKEGVVFTGAGISTESGIPDFRSPGGIWTKYQPIYFKDFMASEEMRRESWRRKFASDTVISEAKPNKGHLAIAKLVQTGKVSTVITQNIDDLHQVSGVPDDRIIELHGNATYSSCLECGKRYEHEEIKKIFAVDETLPLCEACGGIIKTATISFGQSMPVAEMEAAGRATMACDMFISIGSSLVVYPAAGFPEMASRNGAKLVIINRDPTPLDSIADLVLNTEIGPTLSAVVDFE